MSQRLRLPLRACGVLLLVAGVATGCAGGKKNKAPLLTAEQLYEKGMRELSRHKLLDAIATLEKVDIGYDVEKREELEPLIRIAMADARFYQNTGVAWIDAQTMYADFVTFYASHPLAAYAQFQVGVCSMKHVIHPSRDQSQTHRAIDALRDVQRLYPQSPYARAAQSMIRKAEANLAEHEFLVGHFYMKRKRYDAATRRFNTVLSRYPDYADREKIYFYLGRSFVLAKKDAEGRLYLSKLLTDYPDGKYDEQARKFLKMTSGPSLDANGATD